MKRSLIRLMMAAVLMAASILLFLNNMKWSIEFTGGISFGLDHEVSSTALSQSIDDAMEEAGITSYEFSSDDVDGMTQGLLKIALGDDAMVKEITSLVKKHLVEDGFSEDESQLASFSIIGPSIGEFMRNSAKRALIIGVILMALYMMISFAGVRRVIPPAVLAIVTIVTMLFDVSIPSGAYGLLMHFNSTVQINTVFIIAILTTMGYSINDTIIIFDRVRENITKDEKGLARGTVLLGNVIEDSLRQTMKRSLGTSISTFVVVVAMYVLGSGIIQTFSFTIGIGIIAGTFSSLFIAAPLTYVLMGKYFSEKGKIK